MKLKIICTIIFLLCVNAVSGQENQYTLSNLGWLSGYWTTSEDGSVTEELWTHASGYMMLGLHRDVSANGRSSFEYLRIIQSNDGIYYLASPGGSPATSFKLKGLTGKSVVFENPDHDFPQRILYSLENDSTLNVAIEGDMNGETRQMSWTWYRTKPKF